MHTYLIPESPVGALTLAADDDGRLCRLEFGEWSPRVRAAEVVRVEAADGVIADTLRELDEYFAGTRREFDVPLAPQGTPFQLAVWDALRTIPYGETTSYGEIARSVGRPNAVRAVGQANGRNPIAIIVPCHRVIGSDRSLTGYGGGMDRKRYLLGLENASVFTPALDL
ncbi:MAG TPA: methylated-DNA--[protein]-cysteine S-methyltransferase [Acidimicrobiia bacterium]|jgi:methylated-DNA-[protein]-cysteine S-methyltransferase|nr:methylated-DNA--[protein]-cysteine S-methyltransferase [Acidimicrobiia bacterium]